MWSRACFRGWAARPLEYASSKACRLQSDLLRPRERNRFQLVYRLSRIPNGLHQSGESAFDQRATPVRRTNQIRSFGTVKKQGR